MTDEIQRNEYEQFIRLYEIRHGELHAEVKELENDIKKQLYDMSKQMDDLKTTVTSNKTDGWKLTATSLISLIVGYLVYYAQHLLMPK